VTHESIMAVLSKRRVPKRLPQTQRVRAVAILNRLISTRIVVLGDQLNESVRVADSALRRGAP